MLALDVDRCTVAWVEPQRAVDSALINLAHKEGWTLDRLCREAFERGLFQEQKEKANGPVTVYPGRADS